MMTSKAQRSKTRPGKKKSFSVAYKMSDQRERKCSSYKRWLYDCDKSKPKVTKWREQKKISSFYDADRDEAGWLDKSVKFEEISSDDDDRTLDVEECSGNSTSQFSDVCGTHTTVSPSENCCFQSANSLSSDSSIEISISTVLEAGLPIGRLN